jgi:GNAT superfamily N-acetyltransferase
VLFRSIETGAQEAALELWCRVFGVNRPYFERYFQVDPWYRTGDCLGAWDGDALVSAVHVCRRPLRHEGETLWCGSIANVATLPEYRARGLSRELLSQSIDRMEAEGMDFSILFTGRFGHYAPLGWEHVRIPTAVLTLSGDAAGDEPWPAAGPDEVELDACRRLYESVNDRPVAQERPEPYFRGWVGWSWGQWKVEVLRRDDGYLVLGRPGKAEEPARVVELGGTPAARAALLAEAAVRARQRGADRLAIALPPSGDAGEYAGLGAVAVCRGGGTMLRNVRLAEEQYREIAGLYESGRAVWWSSDGL